MAFLFLMTRERNENLKQIQYCLGEAPVLIGVPFDGLCDIRSRDCLRTRVIGYNFVDSPDLLCRTRQVKVKNIVDKNIIIFHRCYKFRAFKITIFTIYHMTNTNVCYLTTVLDFGQTLY